jgi:DNA-binding transcriptional MerR regulator
MHDPLHDIQHYGKNLTITQVIKFFEKININITRPMIQNYIRMNLLPNPVNKRFYTHKHLAALVIIDYLKSVFEINDIKAALLPYMDREGLPLEVYNKLINQPLTNNDALLLMIHAADIKNQAIKAIHSLPNGTVNTILPE